MRDTFDAAFGRKQAFRFDIASHGAAVHFFCDIALYVFSCHIIDKSDGIVFVPDFFRHIDAVGSKDDAFLHVHESDVVVFFGKIGAAFFKGQAR